MTNDFEDKKLSTTCIQILKNFKEITGTEEKKARKVLDTENWNLERAINKFYETEREQDDFVVCVDENNSITDVEIKDIEANPGLVDEKGEMKRAIEESLVEHMSKEPSAEEMFKILSENYKEKDLVALRKLCNDHEGRSGDLEMYLEKNFSSIPTRQEAACVRLRADMEESITELRRAKVEGAEVMSVESCPSCHTPQITQDHTINKVFCCSSCKEEYCRQCWEPQHIPQPCAKTANLWNTDDKFEVVRVLPTREFDEEDAMAIEYRKAEGQLLRMQAQGFNTGLKIHSIDVVKNLTLQAKFDVKKAELTKQGLGKSLLLFHGTPNVNIDGILRNNFDLTKIANGRAYGDGVYFSECPEVSLGYSSGRVISSWATSQWARLLLSRGARGKKRKMGQEEKQVAEGVSASLLLCQVLTGNNSKEVKHPVTGRAGQNTQAGGAAHEQRSWAVVVPETDQILPRYVINFQ